MATTIITGRDLELTIDGTDYASQAGSVTMTLNVNRQEYNTLAATEYKSGYATGSLSVELLQDWGAVSSICEALFTAAKTEPDVPIAFTFTANTGSVFTGNCYPAYPDAGGSADGSGLMATVELTIQDGDVTLA